MELVVHPFFDDSGNISSYYSFISDITQRKQAEEALVRAKEEWELTFDNVPDLIAIIDDRHRILRVNRAMARKLGLEPGQCIGLPCYKYVHGLSEAPAFCPHSITLKDGLQHVAEVHEDRLGGDFLVSTTPLFDENGKMLGSVHVARDITERKKVEEELRKAHNELERSNRDLQDFAFVASHDLQEPLRKVVSFGEILDDRLLGRAGRGGQRLSQQDGQSVSQDAGPYKGFAPVVEGHFRGTGIYSRRPRQPGPGSHNGHRGPHT